MKRRRWSQRRRWWRCVRGQKGEDVKRKEIASESRMMRRIGNGFVDKEEKDKEEDCGE